MFWQNIVHWKKEWQTIAVYLPWEYYEQYKKAERCETGRWAPQISRCPICYWRRAEKYSKKNEEAEPKQKQPLVVDVSGGESKVQCCKEQYCVGTWNVRSINQGKLKVVKQVLARVNNNILGISGIKWVRMGEFNSDDHYIYYCEQESLRRNGVAPSQQKSLKCSTWLQSQKWQNDLCSFSRQTTQIHSNPSLHPNK